MQFTVKQQLTPKQIPLDQVVMGDGRTIVHTDGRETFTFQCVAREGDGFPPDEAGTIVAITRHGWLGRKGATITGDNFELAQFCTHFRREPARESRYRDEDDMRLWRLPSLKPEGNGHDLVAPCAIINYGTRKLLLAHIENHQPPYSAHRPWFYFGYYESDDYINWRNFQKVYEGEGSQGASMTSAMWINHQLVIYYYTDRGLHVGAFNPKYGSLYGYQKESKLWTRMPVSPTNDRSIETTPVVPNAWYGSAVWNDYLRLFIMVANTNWHGSDHSVWLFYSVDGLDWQAWGQLMAPADKYYYPVLINEAGTDLSRIGQVAYLFYQQEDERNCPPRSNGRLWMRRKIVFIKPASV